MTQMIEVKVPDIGDFAEVPVIDICVAIGDQVEAEASLLTLESDKATMDVPSPAKGRVTEIKVKVGDKVSEGMIVVILEKEASDAKAALAPQAAPTPSLPPVPKEAPTPATSFAGTADLSCDLLVLGAGPGGYSAAFRGADLGLKTILVERYSTLGGVCLNVGCIPSKALLHVVEVMEEASHLGKLGVTFDPPQVNIDQLRAHKEKVVGKLTGGLAQMAKMRKVEVVQGVGSFVDAQHLQVSSETGVKTIAFARCIIAAGSSAVHLPFLPEDPRIVDSTGALALAFVPPKMLVIGGGIIGLEMATVYAALGAKIDVVEMLDGLMQGPDRDVVKIWEKENKSRFENILLNTKTTSVVAQKDGLYVNFEGEGAPKEPVRYDLILQSAGRRPNGKTIGADKAGILVDERGFIPVDAQMKTNVPSIFAIGDVVGNPMLAHKAVHEAHVAAEVIAGELQKNDALARTAFDAKVIPGVAYTHPEVAWVGITEETAKKEGRAISVAKFPWAASGRAIANGAEYGLTKLIFDEATHRIIGGAIVGPSAGDMIGEIALAIEMGADAMDIGKTIHPHPTLGESIGMAAEVAHGACTDLPPMKKH